MDLPELITDLITCQREKVWKRRTEVAWKKSVCHFCFPVSRCLSQEHISFSVAAHSPPHPKPSILAEGPGSSAGTSVTVSGDRRSPKFIHHSYRKT